MSRSRDEAIKNGVEVADVQHTMKRRTTWHDYASVGTYMLTLVVADRKPLLGILRGDGFAAEGSADTARVELSSLGKIIRDEEVKKISRFYPMVDVWKVCVMPDHLHMIVRVKERLPQGKHLGNVVSGFKAGCSQAWWHLLDGANTTPCGEPQGTESTLKSAASPTVSSAPTTVPAGSPVGLHRPVLFEKGYCDKILLREGQLENWKRYLDDNPRRLAVKRQRPEFFTIVNHVSIGEWQCQMVGNCFLLEIPEKAAVIVHKAYSDNEFERLRNEWLAIGEAGGVIVSTGIAPREKIVMREAMDRGYRIIVLRENGFPPLYKPSGEAFNACLEGRLLLISPWDYHMQRHVVSREQCLQMNRMAEYIVEHGAL